MKDFGTVITSMITPFDRNLQLDEDKIKFLTNYLADNGSDSVIVGSVTGESETLTLEERLLLLKYTKHHAKKRLKVIASIGMATPFETFKFVEQIDELSYADGIIVSIPYSIGLNQEGIYDFIKTITEITELPLFLYNGPIKAGVYIEPDTVIKLSYLPTVAGIQEASEDIPAIINIINNSSDDFHVYSGDDRYALAILGIGGRGVVSVASHIMGRKIKSMIDYFKRGLLERAFHYHKELCVYFDDLHQRRPTFIKSIYKSNHIDMGDIRDVYLKTSKEDEMFAKIVFGNVY